MSEKRFEYDEKDNIIYDNKGVDDYYFLNNPEEMEKFINLINTTEDEWREKYNHMQEEYLKILHENTEKDLKISELEKELTLMKDKAYYYGCCAIGETSSNYDKDIDEFRKEIYGEEKAEQIKQQEIKEHQESLQRLKEQRLVKVNCYKCKHGVWFGSEEGLTCEKRIKPFPNECEYFTGHGTIYVL